MTDNIRVLVVSDSHKGNTGFGKVAFHIIQALRDYSLASQPKDGACIEVAQLAWFNRPDLPNETLCHIFPTKTIVVDGKTTFDPNDNYGQITFGSVVAKYKPEIVVSIGNLHMTQPIWDSPFKNTFVHISYHPMDSPNLRPYVEKAYKNINVPVFYTKESRDLACKHLPEDLKGRVLTFSRIIHHGVSDPRNLIDGKASPTLIEIRKRRAEAPDPLILGYFGRNTERKMAPMAFLGMEYYMRVLAPKKQNVIVVYNTPEADMMGSRIAPPMNDFMKINPDLSNPEFQKSLIRVQEDESFVGGGIPESQLYSILKEIDILVAPGPEGWGLCLAEAAICGATVVTCERGAAPDWIRTFLPETKYQFITDYGTYPTTSGCILPITTPVEVAKAIRRANQSLDRSQHHHTSTPYLPRWNDMGKSFVDLVRSQKRSVPRVAYVTV